MGDMASITITGRLTKDAVFEQLPNSQAHAAKFAVANNFYDYATKGTSSAFYEVRIVFGAARVDKVRQLLVQGRLVGVSGHLRPRTSPEGKTWLNVDAQDFDLVGPPPQDGQAPQREPWDRAPQQAPTQPPYRQQAPPQAPPQGGQWAPPPQAPPQGGQWAPPVQAPPQQMPPPQSPPQAPPQAAPNQGSPPPWAAPQG